LVARNANCAQGKKVADGPLREDDRGEPVSDQTSHIEDVVAAPGLIELEGFRKWRAVIVDCPPPDDNPSTTRSSFAGFMACRRRPLGCLVPWLPGPRPMASLAASAAGSMFMGMELPHYLRLALPYSPLTPRSTRPCRCTSLRCHTVLPADVEAYIGSPTERRGARLTIGFAAWGWTSDRHRNRRRRPQDGFVPSA
jgi:hypothetical protein